MSDAATADFSAAAQALVDGCVDLAADEDRVALLHTVCSGLGDELYPSFVQLLWVVGRQGDHGAQAVIARTLVHALRTGRLPSGRRGAWGANHRAARSLGPIEYLCAWYAQDEERSMSPEQFQSGAGALLELVGSANEARLLYCEKLLADVDDPIGGTLTRSTREAMRALATTWGQGAAATDACARFLAEIDRGRPNTLAALAQSGRARLTGV